MPRPSRTYKERLVQDASVHRQPKGPPAMPIPKEVHISLGTLASQLSVTHAALEDLVNKNDSLEGSAIDDALNDLESAIDHVNRVLEDEA